MNSAPNKSLGGTRHFDKNGNFVRHDPPTQSGATSPAEGKAASSARGTKSVARTAKAAKAAPKKKPATSKPAATATDAAPPAAAVDSQ